VYDSIHNMNTVQAVIFDMDGVLLDTERICRICWSKAAEEYGISGIDTVYRACVGMNVHDTRDLLKTQFGSDFDADMFYERTNQLFRQIESQSGIPRMPAVFECLDAIKLAGIRIAVASSTKTETVHRQLKQAGIADYFESITCGDTVIHSKPAPDIYLQACKNLSLDPAYCFAVEDSPNGVRSACAAGIRCIMVPDQIQPAEAFEQMAYCICHSLADVPAQIIPLIKMQ
jgi:HAD superfamily hydrolase (TIGR01509 family)